MPDLDAAFQLMLTTLQMYYDERKRHGDDSLEADGFRREFAGQRRIVHALCGEQVKTQLLDRLRAKGLNIPHCGPRTSDGGFSGIDSDADVHF